MNLGRLLLLLALLAGPVSAADLTIGFVGTLTGPTAGIAQDQLDGFRLAVRHLGGRIGGMEFALTVTDDRRDPKLAVQQAEALWRAGRLHVLLLSSPIEAADQLAPLAAEHRTVILGMGDASPALAGRSCSPFYFSLAPRDDLAQQMAGQYLQSQGYKKLAVFEPEHRDHALAAFQRGFKGGIAEVKGRLGHMDFQRDIKAAQETRADGAYFLYGNGMATEFLLQYSASGLREQIPLFATTEATDLALIAAAAPASMDLYSVGTWTETLDAPSNRRLADFEGDYGRILSVHAAEGYDAAIALEAALRAIDRKSSGDPDALRIALKRVDFSSTRGSFRFDNDQFPVLTWYLRQVAADARGRPINDLRGVIQKDVRDPLAGECPMRGPEPLPGKPGVKKP